MIQKIIKPIITLTSLTLLAACATDRSVSPPLGSAKVGAVHHATTYPPFTPTTIAQNTPTLKFTQITDNVFVILDTSSSKNTIYDKGNLHDSKFTVQKQFLNQFNKTIPDDITLSSGLRSFGFGQCTDWSNSKLFQAITPHNRLNFQANMNKANCASGGSPMETALSLASTDLEKAQGNIALLIVSDGDKIASSALDNAKQLENKFGDRLCIYSVWVGNASEQQGQFFLQELSNIAACGKNINLDDVNTSSKMGSFVEDMLFTQATIIPKKPEPLDSDNDGVLDKEDVCPDTPKGATVNKQGCWSITGLQFDTNKATIKKGYESSLNSAIKVLKDNPSLHIQIEGHTDSVGSDKHNQDLSARRANSVQQYLVERDIDINRLTNKGFGEHQPIADNETDAGRAENRRVVFSITKR